MTIGWILLGILGAVALGLVVVGLAAKTALAAMEGPLTRRVAARLRPEDIVAKDLRANSLGVSSKGRFQARGNGALVLTNASLHFFQLVPESELAIPLTAIEGVTFVRSHLGKSLGYRLLHVGFAAPHGTDGVAWFVPDPDAWKRDLEAAIARATEPTGVSS